MLLHIVTLRHNTS